MDQSFQGKTDADKLFAEQLVRAIESVHGVQGIIPVPIERQPLPYGWNGQFDPYTRTITISPNAPFPLSTGAHEIGHALDGVFLVQASQLGRLDGPTSLYASQYAVDNRGILTDWLEAALQTHRVKELEQIRRQFSFMSAGWNELAYLLYPTEIWARAYEQFIATLTRDADLQAQFQQKSQKELQVGDVKCRVYWTQEEFHLIESEIRRVLESLGWM
jgi:hypothetical protein